MQKILFHVPGLGFPIYGYGVMLVIGLICAMQLAQYLARKSKLNPELFANAAILALISGIAGARLSHIFENIHTYTNPEFSAWQNFINAINIRNGGLTYYGGFLLATPTLIGYALWKKIPLRLGMDIVAPCILVGLGFGRIGCFLNGCCYGAECSVPWAVQFPYGSDAFISEFDQNTLKVPVPRELIRDNSRLHDYLVMNNQSAVQEPLPQDVFREEDVPGSLKSAETVAANPTLAAVASPLRANALHPTEIYSSIAAFLLALFLVAYFTMPHAPGRVFAAMVFLEGIFRYMLEVIRVEPAVIGRGTTKLPWLPPQSFSMVVSFFLVIAGLILWRAFGQMAARRAEGARPGVIALGKVAISS